MPTHFSIGGTALPADTKYNLLFKVNGEYIFGPTVPYRNSPDGQLYAGVPGSRSGYGDVGPAPKSAVWNYLLKKFEGKYGVLNAQSGTTIAEPEPEAPDIIVEVPKPVERKEDRPPQAQMAGVKTTVPDGYSVGPDGSVKKIPKRVNIARIVAHVFAEDNGTIRGWKVVLGGRDAYPDDKGMVSYTYLSVIYKTEAPSSEDSDDGSLPEITPLPASAVTQAHINGVNGIPAGSTTRYGGTRSTTRHWDSEPTVDGDETSITTPF